MAILLLDEVPEAFDIERDGDGFVCSIPVCECTGGDQIVSLDCRLDRMPEADPETFEFSFSFVVASIETAELPCSTQDRYDVRRYFDGQSIELMLPTVCAALTALVDEVQPAYIYRVTKGRNLPQKALVKHKAITDVLYSAGYGELDSGTDSYGRMFLLMAR